MTGTISIHCKSSSSDEIYLLELGKTSEGRPWFTCSCPAGQNGQACKHRLGILEPNSKALIDIDSEQKTAIHSIISGWDVIKEIQTVSELEKQIEGLKKNVAKQKKKIALLLLAKDA